MVFIQGQVMICKSPFNEISCYIILFNRLQPRRLILGNTPPRGKQKHDYLTKLYY